MSRACAPCATRSASGREPQELAMNIILWLIVGGIVGWIAGLLMRSSHGILMNVVIGIVGAVLGGWLLGPMVGGGTINSGDFSMVSIVVSLIGALVLLAVVNVLRRGSAR